MPQFRILFYANYSILAIQKGGGAEKQEEARKKQEVYV